MGSRDKNRSFVPLPDGERPALAWPTPNRRLFADPARYFAVTAANPAYGRPGWTRDCGRRFHRGCDVAAVDARPTGRTVTVEFTDCSTGRDYLSDQPALVPHDEVFSVDDGVVEACVTRPEASDFGVHVVVRHLWPERAAPYYTLYGHLAWADVADGQWVARGQRIGAMGQTSRNPEARTWMAIAPHLHFEVWDALGRAYDPEAFLRAFLSRDGGER